MSTSSAAEILGVLSRADRRYANRCNDVERESAYLECLTSAVMAHLAGKAATRKSALEALVAAVMADDFDPDGDLVDQAEESVRVVDQIHKYLLAMRARMRGVA